MTDFEMETSNFVLFLLTRSCAALRAADLDWIVGPECVTYLHGVTTDQGRGGRAGINKNVTY